MRQYCLTLLGFVFFFAFAGCDSRRGNEPKSSDQTAAPAHSDRSILETANADSKGPLRLKMMVSDFQAPASVKLLDGTSVDFRPSGSQKVTLLYIWTMYTGSILDDVAILESLARAHPDDSLRILSVNCTDSRSDVQQFVTENKLRIPVAFDADKSLARQLRVQAVPLLYLIDRQGIALRHRIGPLTGVDIEGAIAEIAAK